MPITININEQKNTAQVLITEAGLTTSKNIPLHDLSEAFKNLTSARKDTGYLSNNLLREAVHNTVCRAYYYKEFITNFQYSMRSNMPEAKSNKYGITIEPGSRPTLIIPNFKFTNIVGFISNSNTDAFNPSCYQILSVLPDIMGNVNDTSRTVRFFPNQWDSNICWPREFNQEILKNRNIVAQSTFVSQYLNSKFNSDLFEGKLDTSKLQPYKEELNEFFKEIFRLNSDEIRSADNVGWFYLVYYFLVVIKNIEPTALAQNNYTSNLKNYFDRYL